MLEDPPYNMIVAATNDKPEDWLEDLPLPSHLLCYERFKDPDVIVKQCLKQLKVEGVNAKADKAFSASAPLVMRIFLSIYDEARSNNLIVDNEEDSGLGEDYYDQALLLDLEDEERVELLKRAAEAGVQPAIHDVLEAYYYGWGCERDMEAVVDWLFDNNIVLTGELWDIVREFFDDEQRFRVLTLASATGYIPALIELAQAYYNGWGVENDPAKALALAEKIDINKLDLLERTGGWKSSGIYMGVLADIYDCLADDYDGGTEKIFEDSSKAQKLYKKALTINLRLANSDLKDSDSAYFYLYLSYYYGKGVKKDLNEALKWIMKGIEVQPSCIYFGGATKILLEAKQKSRAEKLWRQYFNWLKSCDDLEKISSSEIHPYQQQVENFDISPIHTENDVKVIRELTKKSQDKGIKEFITWLNKTRLVSAKFIKQDSMAEDTKTGLMWLRFAHGQVWQNGTAEGDVKYVSWNEASKVINNFNRRKYGGYTDWRLPTIDELKLLIDKIKGEEGNYIDADVFPNNVGGWFWSSSPFTYDSDDRLWWFVYFDSGNLRLSLTTVMIAYGGLCISIVVMTTWSTSTATTLYGSCVEMQFINQSAVN
ncbi:MAG: DUF1566 domain-containing protein [Methylovulum sp.]|nr:DUF1566 domain-containing protein [Methylovulum sp.]